MATTIVIGGFFGDEGKGKIVSHLVREDSPSIVARGGVGPNAGHTVKIGDKEFGTRLTPSGFFNKNCRLLIGAGTLIDPEVMQKEIQQLEIEEKIGIDKRCGIIEQKHIKKDKQSKRLSGEIETTGTGCGPANEDRAARKLKQAKDIPKLKKYLTDVPKEINKAINKNEDIIVEGAQGFGLSLIYGTYPYVTSKDTGASQAASDVGIGPTKIDEVLIVFKAHPTRVGKGPFPTEYTKQEALEHGVEEYGTVTGRPRRVGSWMKDWAEYAVMVNGATQAAITCIDKYDQNCRGVTQYQNLTPKAKKFIETKESELGIPVTLISTGPKNNETIDLRKEKL
ncbi:Adenylosuccinate synthase PurB [Methanonatronarchaeum thermophilum]|uniref:Adenylosuccinate synthetase n=1 Tax=Methanonatronarchaeum thermophilum TaxID=1927129 RepID=A0A1Y3GG11_9EURY|nr:adenylosuccinate synthetase [Methanonatronarchaeum thermophilum]OUJ19243.1 Adenylosuccinate synthase PurB [Methanonatronarchaeum thermophilum]